MRDKYIQHCIEHVGKSQFRTRRMSWETEHIYSQAADVAEIKFKAIGW